MKLAVVRLAETPEGVLVASLGRSDQPPFDGSSGLTAILAMAQSVEGACGPTCSRCYAE